MIGSRDIEGLEDTMANHGMTELEARMFHGLKESRHQDAFLSWDDLELARFMAKYLIDHLPGEASGEHGREG